MQKMKSLIAIAVLLLAPAAASAQVVPPPPPPPPVSPTPPVPPTPPVQVVGPGFVNSDAIRDAIRLAQDAGTFVINADAVRAQAMAQADMAMRQVDLAALQSNLSMMRPGFVYSGSQDQLFHFENGQMVGSNSSSYNSGLNLLNSRDYEQAIVRFDRVVTSKDSHTDGALYWKAFAQFRLGKGPDALATIAQLRKDYAQSPYLTDAKVLEADVRKFSGQAADVANMSDDDIKILAIQSMANTNPDQAIPLLEGVLSKTNNLKVKKQAIYVLATLSQPRAHEIILTYAKGSSGNPDLQREAITRLASRGKGTATSAELKSIYETTTNVEIKRWVLDAMRVSGDRNGLYQVINSTTTPIDLRRTAVNGVADIAAPTDLWTLYQKEENRELRGQMVSVFSSMGAVDQLMQIIKVEKDPEVKRQAIRALGNQKSDKTGAALVDIYAEADKDTRNIVISSLGNQNNAEGLVAIARKETSLDLKTAIVRKLSDMAPRSKVAADYLMEIIK